MAFREDHLTKLHTLVRRRTIGLFSACLWFVYGPQKRSKTIYLACIGWIAVDAATSIGVMLHR